jgi:hypothetical protein
MPILIEAWQRRRIARATASEAVFGTPFAGSIEGIEFFNAPSFALSGQVQRQAGRRE